jgi:hypothetical protein
MERLWEFVAHFFLQRIASSSRWVAVFLVLAAVSVAVHFSLHPYLVQATIAHLPSSATAEEKALMAQVLNDELPVRLLFIPVRLLVGWSAFALILFGIAMAYRPAERLHYRRVLALEVRAETCNVAGQVAAALYLLVMKANGTGPVEIPFSAANIIPSSDVVMFSLLNALNLFTLLYVVFLTEGIALQTGFSRRKAIFVVLPAWGLSVLFQVGTISFLRETMHLRV